MKKRNILLSIILVIAMICCACGSGNPFEGQWTGTLDLTRQFEDGIKANYPDLADYVDFEDLVFVLDVTFSDGEMSMAVTQDSIDAFMENFEAGMQNIGKGALEDWLETQDMTLEEVVAESGMDEAAYLADRYEQMGIYKMTSAMKEVTNSSLDGLSKVKGTYTFDETNIHLSYEDNTYEDIPYVFDGEELTLTIKGKGFSLRIVCKAC